MCGGGEERVCESEAGRFWGAEPEGQTLKVTGAFLGHKAPAHVPPHTHSLVSSSFHWPGVYSSFLLGLVPSWLGASFLPLLTPAFPVQWELGKDLGPTLFPSSDTSLLRYPVTQFPGPQIEFLAILHPSRRDWRSAYVNE